MAAPCDLHLEKRRVGDKVNPPSAEHEGGQRKRWRKERVLATRHMTLSQLPCALFGEVFGYLDLPINQSSLRLTCTGAVRAFDDGIANMMRLNAVQVVADGHWAPISESFPFDCPSSPAAVCAVYIARPDSFINASGAQRFFRCSLVILNAVSITEDVMRRIRGDFVMECHRVVPCFVPNCRFTRCDCGPAVNSCSLVAFEIYDHVGLLYPGRCRRTWGPSARISDISHLGDVDIALIALPRSSDLSREPQPKRHSIAELLACTNASTRPRVTHLQCSSGYRGDPIITDADLQALLPYMTSLTSIDARECDWAVTDTEMLAIASHCPCLTRLQVDDCGKRVTDVGIVAIASSCRRLTWLDVADCDVTDDGLRTLAPLCVSLHHLSLSSCERVTDAGLEAIGEHCTRLEKLHIARTGAGVTDAGIRSVVIGCPDLALLDVGGARCLTDATLACIAEHCRNLTELRAGGNTVITVRGLDVVARRCTRLRRICLWARLFAHGRDLEFTTLLSLHPHLDCSMSLSW
jgi:hypothetical protein